MKIFVVFGFNFDMSLLKIEIMNLLNVMSKYFDILNIGIVDLVLIIKKMDKEFKVVGYDKV